MYVFVIFSLTTKEEDVINSIHEFTLVIYVADPFYALIMM